MDVFGRTAISFAGRSGQDWFDDLFSKQQVGANGLGAVGPKFVTSAVLTAKDQIFAARLGQIVGGLTSSIGRFGPTGVFADLLSQIMPGEAFGFGRQSGQTLEDVSNARFIKVEPRRQSWT